MPRHAARVDDNQSEIVEALRKHGAAVAHLHTVGGGMGDVIVAYPKRCPFCQYGKFPYNHLLEIKDGRKRASKQKLTPDELTFHEMWHAAGGQIEIATSIEGALRVVGIIND